MTTPILIVGHQNPDNDSISSAVAYAYLKNQLMARATPEGEKPKYEYVAARLGAMPPESKWVLEKNGIPYPRRIDHIHARVKDVMSPDPISVFHDATILQAGRMLRKYNIRSLVVMNDDETYKGLITTRMIAERYIASTDLMETRGASPMAVAADLIDSLDQTVDELLETEVLVVDKNALLKEAAEDLMGHSLREAVVLDDDDRCIGIVTRSDIAVKPKRKVILVDHNEKRQSVHGIDEADVVEIVDHHRIGDVSSANPIQFLNMPWGSTATIITTEFRKYDVTIPPAIAEVLLSAILTDTVILKSPTATDVDREQVAFLADIIGCDPTAFGIELYKARGADENMPVERLVGADAKEFEYGDGIVYIAQRETVDLASVLKREDEIREYMRKQVAEHEYDFFLLMVTDIVKEGSQFICEGNVRALNRIFNIKCKGEGGTWMPGVLSRKKQVAARILG